MMKKTLLSGASMLTLAVVLAGGGCGGSKQEPVLNQRNSSNTTVTPPSTNPTGSNPTTEAPKPPAAVGGKMDITQWKVMLTVPKDLQNIQYSVRSDSKKDISYAYFTTQELIDKGSDGCAAENSPLGTITKTKKVEADGPMAAPSNAKKIGDYYYYYSGPQSTCSTKTEVLDLANTQAKQLQNAFDSIRVAE
jgi:hypothetical protein